MMSSEEFGALFMQQKVACLTNRGYYMVARRYEFYVRVARTISHDWVQRTIEIREHKIVMTLFFLHVLYKSQWWRLFDDFPKICNHFLKISEDFPRLFRRPDKCSWTFSENFRKFPKTFEEDPKMFRWYTNEFKSNLSDKLDSSEIIDIFTCEDIVSFLSIICYHSVYHGLLY